MDEESIKKLEGLLSPCDIPMLDIITGSLDILGTTLNVLADRNCNKTNISIFYGTMAAMLIILYPELKNINKTAILEFCKAVDFAISEMINGNMPNIEDDSQEE